MHITEYIVLHISAYICIFDAYFSLHILALYCIFLFPINVVKIISIDDVATDLDVGLVDVKSGTSKF